MAKKSTLGNIDFTEKPLISKTDNPPAAADRKGTPKPIGVYLNAEDRQAFDDIAAKHNVNRHMLLSFAAQNFLSKYRSGEIKIETEVKAGKVTIKT